jgi:DNA invertase Pin-like site-specific DNA recombinase
MVTGKFISYLRVSTQRQGESGLGIEAQRQAVAAYLNGGAWSLIAEYVEIETGKRNDRPQLTAALHRAKVSNATLVIAKLDRLSRNAAFLLNLRDAGVRFVCADMPEANNLTIGIMAIIAQDERERISARTKAALAAKRMRGERLGTDNWAALQCAGVGRAGWTLGADANREKADRFAADLMPIIDDIRAEGVTSDRGIARQLNERGIETAHGRSWSATQVGRMLQRGAKTG